jgi:hypothetical protein
LAEENLSEIVFQHCRVDNGINDSTSFNSISPLSISSRRQIFKKRGLYNLDCSLKIWRKVGKKRRKSGKRGKEKAKGRAEREEEEEEARKSDNVRF